MGVGHLEQPGSKSKAMHSRMFEHLEALHDANVNESLAGVMAKFGIQNRTTNACWRATRFGHSIHIG